MTPKEAGYVPDSPAQDKVCSNCNYFIEPDSCEMVDGTIDPKGVCLLWTPVDTEGHLFG